MRRLVYIIGVLASSAIVILAVVFAMAVYWGRALDAESKTFVNGAVPAIAATWSKQQLLNLGTPELRESVKPEELTAFFDGLSQLGPLVKYEGATGDSTFSYFIGSGSTVSAKYVAKAIFQNGDATFRIVLRKRDGRWMIHNFRVDPTLDIRSAKHT